MASEKNRIKATLSGLASMVLGTALVIGTILVINQFASDKQSAEAERTAQIDYQKKEKPKPKKMVEKKEPPKRQPNRRPPAPLTGLDSSLTGLDLGLPAFDANDLGGLSGDLLGSSDDVIMTDESVDNPPRPTSQGPLPYPPRAKARGIEGYVLLSVLISPTGDVERVKVLESYPTGMFDDIAANGVRGWKFEPASYQGASVRVWAKQRVRFELS